LASLNGIVQEYLTELSIPATQVEKDEILDKIQPDPKVRESHNVEVCDRLIIYFLMLIDLLLTYLYTI